MSSSQWPCQVDDVMLSLEEEVEAKQGLWAPPKPRVSGSTGQGWAGWRFVFLDEFPGEVATADLRTTPEETTSELELQEQPIRNVTPI